MHDHAVNPVLYVEYESISGADKTILEFVGHDSQADLASPNGEARRDHQHEAELKLILSSNARTGTSQRTLLRKRIWGMPLGVRIRSGGGTPAARHGRRPGLHLLC